MPQRPRQGRAARTRQHIIDTAAAAFAEHGFDGVSLNDVVTASGLSKGAFYFHFSSKEELALAAFRAKQEELLSRLGEQPALTSIADRTVWVMRRRAQLIREDPALRCVSRLGGQFNLHAAPGSPYASYLGDAVRNISSMVAEGQRRGEFRADLDPEEVGWVIFAGFVGIDSLSQFSGGKDLESRTDQLTDLLLHGLLKTGGRTRPRREPGKEQHDGSKRSGRPRSGPESSARAPKRLPRDRQA